MATTKICKIESRLDHVIDYATDKNKTKNLRYINENELSFSVRSALKYATNPEKTEKQYFVSGVNCEPENALKQMMETKKKFKKDKYNKNNKIAAFHAYQSFCEGEVSPKKAHEIGIKLAEEMCGDRFEVVVSTHLNMKCVHNHFVVNSVSSVHGKKYYSNLENTAILRQTSDDICDEYGLKVLRKGDYKVKKVDFNYYFKKSVKNSDMYIFAKEDIDFAIKQTRTYKDFEKIMRTLGYYVFKRGGGISVKKDTMKRNMRITLRESITGLGKICHKDLRSLDR